MTYKKFSSLAGYFKGYRKQESQLLTLLLFLWFFFVEWQNPSKVRYWKKIVNEADRYRAAFRVLQKTERALMAVFPFLKPLCWNVVVEYRA